MPASIRRWRATFHNRAHRAFLGRHFGLPMAVVSERAAQAALALLAERGILEPYARTAAGPGRRRRFWVASELIAMATDWSSP